MAFHGPYIPQRLPVKLVFKDSQLPRFVLYGRYLLVTEQILVVAYSTVLDILFQRNVQKASFVSHRVFTYVARSLYNISSVLLGVRPFQSDDTENEREGS